jgi:hypothetical protein
VRAREWGQTNDARHAPCTRGVRELEEARQHPGREVAFERRPEPDGRLAPGLPATIRWARRHSATGARRLGRVLSRLGTHSMTERDKTIARAWNRLQRNWWAHDEIFRACRESPRRAWRLLGLLADLATSQELVEDLGAGPLEDFIRAHAPAFIGQIESRALEHPRFRRALRNTWLPEAGDTISSRLFALGVRAIGVKPEKWQDNNRMQRSIASRRSPGKESQRAPRAPSRTGARR